MSYLYLQDLISCLYKQERPFNNILHFSWEQVDKVLISFVYVNYSFGNFNPNGRTRVKIFSYIHPFNTYTHVLYIQMDRQIDLIPTDVKHGVTIPGICCGTKYTILGQKYTIACRKLTLWGQRVINYIIQNRDKCNKEQFSGALKGDTWRFELIRVCND